MKTIFRPVLFALCLLVTAPCATSGQTRLEEPLTFISADSVVVWGGDFSDLRGMAFIVDQTLEERPVKVNPANYEADLAKWQNDWLPTMTATGAGGFDARTSRAVRNSQMIEQAAALFLQTGHADFMEGIERALFNDQLHEVLTNTEAGVTFDKRMAAQSLVNGLGMVYAYKGTDVWVNFFLNNTAHIRTPEYNLILDQITSMPFNTTMKVRVNGIPRGGFYMRFHLRIPYWSEAQGFPKGRYTLTGEVPAERPKVYVNGRDPLKVKYEDGYLIIDRKWNRGDEILVYFPLNAQYLQRAGGSNTDVAVQSGPLIYSVPDSCDRGLVDPAVPMTIDYDNSGYPIFRGTYATKNYLTGLPLTFTALPYLRSEGRVWLPTTGSSR